MDTKSQIDEYQSCTTTSQRQSHLQCPKLLKIGRADLMIAAAAACTDSAFLDTSHPDRRATKEVNDSDDDAQSTLTYTHRPVPLSTQVDALCQVEADVPVLEQRRVTIDLPSIKSCGKHLQLAQLTDTSNRRISEQPSREKLLNENGKRSCSETLPNGDTTSKKAKINVVTRTDLTHDTFNHNAPCSATKRSAPQALENEHDPKKRSKVSHPVDVVIGGTLESNGEVQMRLAPSAGLVGNTDNEAQTSLIPDKFVENTTSQRPSLSDYTKANFDNARRLLRYLRGPKIKQKDNTPLKGTAASLPAPNQVTEFTNLRLADMPSRNNLKRLANTPRKELSPEEQRSLERAREKDHYCQDFLKAGSGQVVLPSTLAYKIKDAWSTKPVDPTPFLFLKLPAELRNQIYDLVLRQSETIIPACIYARNWIHDGPRRRQKLEAVREPNPLNRTLSILQLNKQIHQEALPVFYHKKHIRLGGLHHVYTFLTQIGPNARALVSELSFTCNKASYADRAVGILQDCSNLESLHIAVDETAFLEKFNIQIHQSDKISLKNTTTMMELARKVRCASVEVTVVNPCWKTNDKLRDDFKTWLRTQMEQ